MKFIDISKDVYHKMYQKTYHDLEITKYVLNKCVFTDKGVAYYVLEDKDLKELNITTDRGKENLSLLRDLEDIEVWFSITEDVSKKIAYRIHLGNNIVYNATERAYDEEIGLLTNTYEYNEYTSSWARHAEEINLVIEGDYPGSGTYTDMLTFSVELYQ